MWRGLFVGRFQPKTGLHTIAVRYRCEAGRESWRLREGLVERKCQTAHRIPRRRDYFVHRGIDSIPTPRLW